MLFPVIVSLIPAGLFCWFWALKNELVVQGNDIWTANIAWVPQLGIDLSFKADAWGLFMALLITGVGTLIALYAGAYLKGDPKRPRFYTFFLIFMMAMLGVVLSDNLIGLFVFWELTSVSSYMLIGYKHENENARISALQALLITGIGGLCLLVGFLLLGNISQTFSFESMLNSKELIQQSPLFTPLLILIFIGAFTKSAQFPFHFWLPNAMAAPTPVSAYLHSSTMVKAGVFLLAKLSPLLSGSPLWHNTLLVVGATTVIWATWLSMAQKDIKKVLAYTTLSALGTLTLLLGIGTAVALKAFLAFFLAHALYKASFFMIAGSIDHETGTRDLTKFNRLRTSMPLTSVVAVLVGLSFSGLPPTWGFIAKESILESIFFNISSWQSLLALTTIVFSALSLVYLGALLVWGIFFSRPLVDGGQDSVAHAKHEAPWAMTLGPLSLGLLGFYFAIFVSPEGHFLFNSIISDWIPASSPLYFSLWHGFTPAFVTTVLVIFLGLLCYRYRIKTWLFFSKHSQAKSFSPEQIYYKAVSDTPTFAKLFFDKIQSGYLRKYIFIVLSFAMIFILWPLHKGLVLRIPQSVWNGIRLEEILINLALIAGAAITLLSKKTFVSLASTGIIGLGVAFFYVFYGAPDLAMTQVLVEALSIILVVIVLFSFSRISVPLSKRSYVLSLSLAAILGASMTFLTLVSLTNKHFPTIAGYFSENSYLLAHGKNIVNVILVDFRGWDTMGEITVLAIASIGVYCLLRWKEEADS